MSLTSIAAREPASVVSVWPTAIRPSPTSAFAPTRGVPTRTDTSHEPLPLVASVGGGGAVFQVTPTISTTAAAAASAGARKRSPRYILRST